MSSSLLELEASLANASTLQGLIPVLQVRIPTSSLWGNILSMVGQRDAFQCHPRRDLSFWQVRAMQGTLEKGGARRASATLLLVMATKGALGDSGNSASLDMMAIFGV